MGIRHNLPVIRVLDDGGVVNENGGPFEGLDRLEARGKVFVLRPPEPVTVSRTEKDVVKLRALYAQGRQVCLERMEELRDYLKH